MGLPNIGPLELIIILAIALLIVGPGRLPEMGNAIGRTIKEFRKASSDITDAATIEADPKPAAPVSTTATATGATATPPAQATEDAEPSRAAPAASDAAPAEATPTAEATGRTAAEPPAAAEPNALSGAATPNTTTSTPLPATPSEPKADGNDA
jgi:TatA/E family protein of Tat protein translocase